MTFTYRQFTFVPSSKTYFADVTDIAGRGDPFHQIYPDAADRGITMIGRTGAEVDYVLGEPIMVNPHSEDAEQMGWYLNPTPESVRKVPGAAGTRVAIVND